MTILWWIYFGGIPAVYSKERKHNRNIFIAYCEAITWPLNIGRTIAKKYYVNPDW